MTDDPQYAWKLKIQSWDNDPYFVASSAPIHIVTVVAASRADAITEGQRAMGEPTRGRHWKIWVLEGTDTRLIERPDSVTHYVCPASPFGETHHMLVTGKCAYCKHTAAELREEQASGA